ncbi:hypothetical protein GCM10022243_10320 [Saccharothrix violaceirubra]
MLLFTTPLPAPERAATQPDDAVGQSIEDAPINAIAPWSSVPYTTSKESRTAACAVTAGTSIAITRATTEVAIPLRWRRTAASIDILVLRGQTWNAVSVGPAIRSGPP